MTGSDGQVHIYGLDLSNTAATPTPQQISSFSVSSTTLICGQTQAQTDEANSQTTFLVLEVAGSGSSDCNSISVPHVFEVVHYTDAATVAPAVVGITSTDITPLYSAGKLSGLVVYDPGSTSLDYYTNSTFTSPVTVASGVTTSFSSYNDSSSLTGSGTDYAFFNVSTSGSTSIYRVTAAGAVIKAYTTTGGLDYGNDPADTNNLYFTDTGSGSSTTFYQLALSGSTAPLALYSATPPSGSSYTLIGSNDSRFFFSQDSTSSGSDSTTLLSIPIGQTSTTPATIGSALSGTVNAFLQAPNGGARSASKLFLTVTNTDSTTTPSKTTYSTLVFDSTGNALQASLANSVFRNNTSVLLNAVVQFQGITATDGTYGGSSPYSYTVANQTTSVYKTPSGTPYVVPTASSAGFLPVSTAIGEFVSYYKGDGTPSAAAYDVSQLLIAPVTVSGSNVSLL